MLRVRNAAAMVVTALLTLFLMAACGGEEVKSSEVYPGQNSFQFVFEDAFTINIKEENKKMLRCEPVIWVHSEEFVTTLTEKSALVKNTIIAICRTKTLADLEQLETMDAIALEITEALNAAFSTDEVRFVTWSYFAFL